MLAALVGIYFIWGTSYLAVKEAVDYFPPLLLVGIRFCAAGMMLLVFCLITKRSMGSLRENRNAAFSGLLMITLSSTLIAIGVKTVDSSMAAVLFSLVPVFVCIMMMASGKKVSRWQWTGTIIGILGLLSMNLQSEHDGKQTGLWLILIAVIATSVAAFFSTHARLPQDVLVSTSVQMLAGGVSATLLGWLNNETIADPSIAALLAFLYLSLVVSVFAYLSYVYILAHAGPVLASSYAFVNPPVALVAGALVLNEPVSGNNMVSIIVVLVGAMAVLLGQPKTP